MKLLVDHHYSAAIAKSLRGQHLDVQTALEWGWQVEQDEPLLQLCVDDGRALLTNNVAGFTVIARRWAATGRGHYGLVFTSDRSLPRDRHTIGVYTGAVGELLRAEPSRCAARSGALAADDYEVT